MAESTEELLRKRSVKLKTITYKGILLPTAEMDKIEKMEIRDDDIWICSFPRSGTTMIQEMTYLIQTMDFEKAKTVQLDDRFPIVEVKNDRFPYYRGVDYINKMSSPRMLKSHLHHFLLPEQLQNGKGRIIYISRNPKDVITSLYHLLQWEEGLEEGQESWEEFFQAFVDGKAVYCPWPDHVIGFWKRREDPNVLFLQYEDVVQDRAATIRRIANFLGRQLTESDVSRICEHCSVDNMRNNNMVNMSYWREITTVNDDAGGGFINKGKAAVWKEFLKPVDAKKIDGLIQQVEERGLLFK